MQCLQNDVYAGGTKSAQAHLRVRSCAIFANISAVYASTNSRLMTWPQSVHDLSCVSMEQHVLH